MQDMDMIEKVFAPGKKLMVEYIDNQMNINSYQTLVEDLEGAYLVLQTPIVNDRPVSFQESQELTLRRIEQQKQEAYVTNVFVIDVRQDKMPLLVCSKPTKIDRTSLRRFTRFDVNLPLSYKIEKDDETFSGRVNDLSLSGCYALVNPDPRLKVDAKLDLYVTIPGEDSTLNLKARAIRVDESDENGKDLFGLALDYEELSDTERETLYYYIFQLQLTSDSILGAGLEMPDQ
ncbi:MAG: flagellar brake protein [Bacillota bacterium]